MPTGCTYGILEGKTKTFKEFAENCMRNFGACIHMRDDDSDKKYTPRVPSDYYTKELQSAKEKLEKAEKMTDAELIEMRKKELEEDKKRHKKNIKETETARKKLDDFLLKAKAYEPPTEEHEGIKKFMIEQLRTTIDYDGDAKYSIEGLANTEIELSNIDANDVRFTLMEQAHKDIAYHLKEHKEELKRCANSNKWVEVFINSLK